MINAVKQLAPEIMQPCLGQKIPYRDHSYDMTVMSVPIRSLDLRVPKAYALQLPGRGYRNNPKTGFGGL